MSRKAYTRVSPSIALREIKTSYCIHEGMVYSIADCSTDVFKNAMGGYQYSEYAQSIFQKNTLDILDRWYLLCEGESIHLFRSYEQAQSALNKKGERKQYS
jgi:hypothetical protein